MKFTKASHKKKISIILIGLVLLAGCQTKDTTRSIDAMESLLKDNIQSNRAVAREVPDEVIGFLMPDLKTDIKSLALNEENRFDVSIRDMPANEFFMSIVEDTPYNMIVPESVSTNLTFSLKQVTLSEVMEHVKNVYGIEYKLTKNGFEVLPMTTVTRTYFIDYLNVSRTGASETNISSNSISGDSGGSSSSQVSTTSEHNFWENVLDGITAIVGEGDDREVVINAQASIVVVRAPLAEQRSVGQYIDSLQEILHRQVILEVKILEVKLSDRYQAGINWAATGTALGANSALASFTGGGSSIAGSGIGSAVSNKSNVAAADLTPGNLSGLNGLLTANAFGGMFGAVLEYSDFSTFIEFLEGQGNVQVLSSPRISTVNNQKAIIKVGTDEYFVTDVTASSTVSAGDEVQTAPDITLEPFFSGIALDVTPQIGRNGIITLHVHPSVSTVSESTKDIELTGNTQSLPLAKSSIRETDSVIKARNGQIVVLGGLMEHTSDEVVTNLPVLGHLPFVGALFRQTRQNDEKSELVVLIKPIIVDNDDWTRESERALEDFTNLKRKFHLGTKPQVYGVGGELEW